MAMTMDQVFVMDEDPDAALGAGMQQQMEAGGAGDAAGRLIGLIKCSEALAMKGQLDEAMGQYNEAIGIASELKDDKAIAAAGNALTKIYVRQAGPGGDEDDLQPALESASDTLRLMQKSGFKKGEAVALCSCGLVYMAMGKPDKGIEYAKMAIAIYQELSAFKGVAAAYMLIKDGCLIKGDTYKASVLATKAASIYQKLGDKRMEAKSMLTLGKCEVAGSDYTKATAACEAAMKLYMEAGDTRGMGDSYDPLIDMLKGKGDYTEAVKLAKQRTSAFHDVGDMSGEAYSLLKLGQLLLEIGEPAKAGRVAEVALGMFAGMNDMGGMKAGKEVMDGAKDAKLVQDINTTLSAQQEYLHIPPTLVVDPGLSKRVQDRFNYAISGF